MAARQLSGLSEQRARTRLFVWALRQRSWLLSWYFICKEKMYMPEKLAGKEGRGRGRSETAGERRSVKSQMP